MQHENTCWSLLESDSPFESFRTRVAWTPYRRYFLLVLRWLCCAMAAVKALNPKAEVARAQAALAVNISAARGLQDVLRSNLGPKGTMKMWVPPELFVQHAWYANSLTLAAIHRFSIAADSGMSPPKSLCLKSRNHPLFITEYLSKTNLK